MRIALVDDIIDRTARLALIDKKATPDLYDMAKYSLDVCCKQLSQWSVDLRAVSPVEQSTVTP